MSAVRVYLQDILRSIERIRNYTRDGRASFETDTRTQDAVARNFEIIGEVVKRLPAEMLATQPDIP